MADPGRPRDAVRHAAVLAATRSVLTEQGYEAVTFSEVASRAGVTRQLVHRWWTDRHELVAEALFAGTDSEWRLDLPGPLADDVRRFVGALVGFAVLPHVAAGIRGLMGARDTPAAVEAGLLEPLRGTLRVLLDHGIERGEVRDGLDLEVDLDLLLGTIRGAITMHLVAERTPPEVVVDHLSDLLTRALRRDVG